MSEHEQTDTTDTHDRIQSDELFEALADRNRREALFHLRQNRLATVDELAVVAAVPDDDADAVRAELVNEHLPVLESLGLVAVDEDEEHVELVADPNDLAEWLDLAMKRDVVGDGSGEGVTAADDTVANEEIKVLLVDDAPDFVSAVADLLEREHDDLDVLTATSAPDAFTVLKNEHIDCIVSDYKMPAIDGLEFLDAVRDEYPGVSFIMFTNKGSDWAADEAVAIGVNDYLQKEANPEGYEKLVASIRSAVRGESPTR
ncbi:response regulator [Haloarchaeobius sp. DFWS5]|uniref:response regulator n=1 Tax=Haloarchaeobius sp. DFWS5 TaxID=3446114 RepID=UPI003EB8EF62